MDSSIIKKGTELELTIDSLAFGGKGVARVDNLVVFVKNAIPGQRVRALIYRKKSGYAEARALEILDESPQATEPVCDHFPVCGGCTFQQLDYASQVDQKRQQVVELFHRMAGIPNQDVDEVIAADQTTHYRNKMEFTFSNRRWVLPGEPEVENPNFALGLHIPKRFDKILDIHTCHIQQDRGNDILQRVREIALKEGLKPYDPKTHIGFLRHLVLRFGIHTGEVMVNIVTSYENPDLLHPIVKGLLDRFPDITCIVNNINTRKADTAFGEWEILLHGTPGIQERIGDLTFEVSANSFFQTNTLQAEKLYTAVLAGADLTQEDVVYDLYSGAGSISLYLSRHAKSVYGFEMINSAVEDATRNSVSNGIGNCYFYSANLDTYFNQKKLPEDIPPPDVIVVDPPRSGMHANMVNQLPLLDAKRIVYVSCNPTTQARDVRILLDQGYRLKKLTMVDMFPHTPHIETVVVMEKDDLKEKVKIKK